jgi:dTDP-4-amino-4,6-dideoxygalactose transaminase
MKMLVDMGEVAISPLQKKLVSKCLSNNRLSYGPMTKEFESKWAKMHHVKYALFCNSGTSALQVAIHALKEKYKWDDGCQVIIPATTFVATMNVVLHNNLRPVFVDVEGDYFNLDYKLIEDKLTVKTKAIIVVHLLGQPANMTQIMRIARRFDLKVIEDSCETVGATFRGKSVGSWGDVSCFSTYASHLVVTGVGGFACTNDTDLAVRIKGLYNHGRDGVYHSIDDDDKNSIEMMKSRFNFVHSGYSYRTTELESALGLGHLARFSKELKKRQDNAAYLISKLKPLQGKNLIKLPLAHTDATHSYMLFALTCLREGDRDKLILFLENNGIMTRYLMPLINQPIVQSIFGNIYGDFPVSTYLIANSFLIGIHPGLTKEDLDYIVKKFYTFYDKRK